MSTPKIYEIDWRRHRWEEDSMCLLQYIGEGQAPPEDEFEDLIVEACRDFLEKENQWVVENLYKRDFTREMDGETLQKYMKVINYEHDDYEKEEAYKKSEIIKFLNDMNPNLTADAVSDFVRGILLGGGSGQDGILIEHAIGEFVNSRPDQWKFFTAEPKVRIGYIYRDFVKGGDPADPKSWTIQH